MVIFAYRSQLVFLIICFMLPGNVGALYAEISCGSGEGDVELFRSLQHHRIFVSSNEALVVVDKETAGYIKRQEQHVKSWPRQSFFKVPQSP
jgi:hypothetical protein